MNFGALAGGAAQGYSKGMDDQRKEKDQARQDKEWAKQDAYEAERKAVIDAATNSHEELNKQNRQIEVDNSTARTAQNVVQNTVAQGINPLLEKPQSDAGILASAAQKQPVAAASGVMTSSTASAMDSAINTPPVDKPVMKPTAMRDTLKLYGDLAQVDLKYGKINGLGMLQAQQAVSQLKDEGIDHAIAQMHHGDIQGGLDTLKSYGKYSGATVVGQSTKGVYEYGGVKMPTTIVNIAMPDGSYQTINTAEYGAARFKMDQALSAAQKGAELGIHGRKADTEAAAQAATGIYQGRMAGVAEKNADTKLTIAEAKEKALENKKPPYKVEGSEVATVLGDPAVDKNGKPVVDIMSGRQIVNRNATREDAFYKWMAQNGITDTNEGLAKYKGNPPAPPPVQPIANLPQGTKQVGTSGGKPVFQTPDGKRFVGG